MFTGIIEELGQVTTTRSAGAETGALIGVRCRTVAEAVAHGASIAVDGVCLTVVDAQPDGDAWRLDFDVMGETLARTGIGALRRGDRVNLERAVRADGRLDGHIVQGHVDGTAQVLARRPGSGWESVRFSLDAGLARYVAEKGSITVNGVSLTVSSVGRDDDGTDIDGTDTHGTDIDGGEWFEVGLIPETLRATNLGQADPGTTVNIEVDVLAKYTERLLQRGVVAAVTP